MSFLQYVELIESLVKTLPQSDCYFRPGPFVSFWLSRTAGEKGIPRGRSLALADFFELPLQDQSLPMLVEIVRVYASLRSICVVQEVLQNKDAASVHFVLFVPLQLSLKPLDGDLEVSCSSATESIV